jgi:hypothetical protein
MFGKIPQNAVADGHARPVAEVFLNGKGFAEPFLGLIQLLAVLEGDHAELMVAGRRAGLVAEVLVDGECLAGPVLRLVPVRWPRSL